MIQWFAEQAEFSLIMPDPPTGTFNYTDPYRTYTPEEALDVLNGVLLTKGFTLVRSGRNLFVIDVESNKIPPPLVQEVPLAELDQRPEVWLYRGAWQEWPVPEATWLVPLSQEELAVKIQAIFKHQSQKDRALFPGPDEREFWQRVEARNKETAETLDRLGLAEYFAMEAYVVEP